MGRWAGYISVAGDVRRRKGANLFRHAEPHGGRNGHFGLPVSERLPRRVPPMPQAATFVRALPMCCPGRILRQRAQELTRYEQMII
jgi:hypothetical protein